MTLTNNHLYTSKNKYKMIKSSIVIIVYIIGLIIGATVLGLWNAETSPKSLLGLGWTAIFLIGLFYAEKNDS
jgi:hypothetical protein